MILVYFAAAFLTVIFAFLAIYFHDLFTSAILLAVSSLFLSLSFFLLQAPDIAITEAAVGAALSTFLIIISVSKTERQE